MTRLINRVSTRCIFQLFQSVWVAQRRAKPARDAHVPRARLVPNAPRERVQHRQVVVPVVAVVPVLVVLARRPVQHAEPAPRPRRIVEGRSRDAGRRTDRSAPLAPTAAMPRPAARGVLELEAPATRVACRNVRRARADDPRRRPVTGRAVTGRAVTGRPVTGRAVNATQARDRRVRSRRLLRSFARIGSLLRRVRGHTSRAPRRVLLRRRPVTRARAVTRRMLIVVRRVSA